ncbi:RNA polymerase sigma factor [Dyadobacter aurulentus]|uniref:RNA polymerase sigma factor n=1 Tax=Dyadobacter sp. UC 10 TaxID=2605428 RepID=UPI0011F34D78|nr:sigma-70 family RNA polymerase sigma factor [Dyadobacter sp. UC 10]KAA0992312.1 sigma-70 family RNA polymerase sigma factor [Dyadobacter sp. UC 10]
MKPFTEHTDDQALWAAMRAGDESAFESLYNRYFQILFSYGKKLAAEEIVSDAIQDLFINIWRSRRTLGQAESVRFYLFRSVRREIVRSLKNETRGEDWEDLDENLLPVQMSPETIYAGDEETFEQTEQIRRWLDLLPPRQHEALLLRYYHNLEYAEVAQVLNIKEQTARNLVQKALAILKRVAILLIVGLLLNQ